MHISIIPGNLEGNGKNSLPFDVRTPAPAMGFEEILNLRIGDQAESNALFKENILPEHRPVERDLDFREDNPVSAGIRVDDTPAEKKENDSNRVARKETEGPEKGITPDEKQNMKAGNSGDGEKEKISNERSISAGARAEVKKSVKTADSEHAERLSALAAELASYINKHNQGLDIKDTLRGIRNAVDEIKNHLEEGKGRKGTAVLKALLDRLASLLEKAERIGRQPGTNNRTIAGRQLLGEVENLAGRIKKASERTRKTGSDDVRETAAKADAKTLLDITVPQRPAAARNDSPDSGYQGNQGLNFSVFKEGKGAHVSQPATPGNMKNPLFEEHLQQIVQQARVVVRDGRNGSLTLRLYPESLGRVNINLGLEQGTLSGRFLVDTPEVRQALLDHLDVVRDHLADAGVTVGDFQVNVRNGGERNVYGGQREQSFFVKSAGTALDDIFEYAAVIQHDGAIDVII